MNFIPLHRFCLNSRSSISRSSARSHVIKSALSCSESWLYLAKIDKAMPLWIFSSDRPPRAIPKISSSGTFKPAANAFNFSTEIF